MMELSELYQTFVDNLLDDDRDVQKIQFLGEAYIEQLGKDPMGDQHASSSIEELATSFGEVADVTEKDLWKYINCLELFTAAICKYPALTLLADRLMLEIRGLADSFSTAIYIPLTLRCVNMMNHTAPAATGYSIDISVLLLDILEILHKSPTQLGSSIDFRTTVMVEKSTFRSGQFKADCVPIVVELLAEHLAQISCLYTFPEVSAETVCRLKLYSRSMETNAKAKVNGLIATIEIDAKGAVDELITEIKSNLDYLEGKRKPYRFGPNTAGAASFLQHDKDKGASPLSIYVATLREKARQSERVAVLKISRPPPGKQSAKEKKNKKKRKEDSQKVSLSSESLAS